MTERIKLHFDPICPWCYQTSRWLKGLEDAGHVELSYGLFSLEMQNRGDEPETMAKAHARSEGSLRTAVVVRKANGEAGVGAFYSAIGRRFHEEGEALELPATIEAALEDAGLDPSMCEEALGDPSTLDAVAQEHRDLVETTRSFGVPTIVVDGGDGPAIFGPVIRDLPSGDEALELFEHTLWLARNDNFAELKRDRRGHPDLESVRQSKERYRKGKEERDRERSANG